jgi:hypothetical protein
MSAKRSGRSFADIDAKRKRYDPEAEGYGSPRDWNDAFFERMGFEEAQRIISEQDQTPREILGLSRGATWDDVRKAYRAKASAYHPDRIAVSGLSLAKATELLTKCNAAFAILAREFGK